MDVLATYDDEDNDKRNKVIEILKNAGYPVKKSKLIVAQIPEGLSIEEMTKRALKLFQNELKTNKTN